MRLGKSAQEKSKRQTPADRKATPRKFHFVMVAVEGVDYSELKRTGASAYFPQVKAALAAEATYPYFAYVPWAPNTLVFRVRYVKGKPVRPEAAVVSVKDHRRWLHVPQDIADR